MQIEDRIASARRLIGTPFRMGGRDQFGMDCVGFIALLFGKEMAIADHYPLRTGRPDIWERELDRLLTRRLGEAQIGDVLLFSPSPLTFHLGLWTGISLIHADAKLRRVVETPGLLSWSRLGAWF